jgi:hypothetical protein
MIIHNGPQDKAILSNVGQVGEFRIRNSAKAFNILSSGLYANKIRAIIRELSCNAVDSHIAAGMATTPFDVHIPNTLEPWFSIRDYGTGLTHEQVTNIYTTYFESTKTNSNDFIGALGLGSKSPFSYTDNFTVTAVKDGRKGIYTAFINEHGVPSIALMAESETKDPNGVEVKFAVNERWDFNKFIDEARVVYTHFKLRPVIHGCNQFNFTDPVYKDKDIIPGVHSVGNRSNSIAIMGNIAYPIDIPNSESVLGNLRSLLNCGLVMEFNIGELDFQASREGLSYIPTTIDAIKNKLEQLNNQLAITIAKEADKIKNLWDRSDYLQSRINETLWQAAVIKYVTDTKFVFFDHNSSYKQFTPVTLKCADLESKYNIKIRAFTISKGTVKTPNIKVDNIYNSNTKVHEETWRVATTKATYFVVTDTRRGAFERAKQHWRTHSSNQSHYVNNVYVIEPADKTREMNISAFMRSIHNPSQVINASNLTQKTKAARSFGKASILKLEVREKSRRNDTVAWANSGTLDDYDDNETYYYIQMNHWTPVGVPYSDLYIWYNDMRMSGVYDDEIYGVRKNDIDAVKNKPNWIELNGHVKNVLNKTDMTNVMGLVKESIDYKSFFKYINGNLNTNSPYYKMYAEFKDVQDGDSYKRQYLTTLMGKYDVQVGKTDPTKLIEQYKEKVVQLKKRYPLINSLSYYGVNVSDVVDYINMVDTTKGI